MMSTQPEPGNHNRNRNLKQIQEGIFIEKFKVKEPPDTFLVFRAQVKVFQKVIVTIDLTKSKNVEVQGFPDSVAKKIVVPFGNALICRVKLNKGWRVKTKLGALCLLPSLDLQRQMMNKFHRQTREDRVRGSRLWSEFDFVSASESELDAFFEEHRGSTFHDCDFASNDKSIGLTEREIIKAWNCIIHWRRPEDFCPEYKLVVADLGLISPSNYISQNSLNDSFPRVLQFLSATPEFVKRLFLYTGNPGKMVKVKILRSGLWEEVVVDPLIPCVPLGGPLFLKNQGPAIWANLLEKAYSKLLKGYVNLQKQSVLNVLLDLTGLPCQEIHYKSFRSNFHLER